MKNIFYRICWTLVLLSFTTEAFGQSGDATARKGKLAGINSHLHSYENFIRNQEKNLYEKLYVSESELELYLHLALKPQLPLQSCLVKPGVEIPFTRFPQAETEKMMQKESHTWLALKPHPQSQATFLLGDSTCLIQLFDGSSIRLATLKDLYQVNSIQFLEKGEFSWRSSDYEPEAVKFLVNQLLGAQFRPELYHFLFHLNAVQFKEALEVYGCTPIDSSIFPNENMEGFAFASGPIMYHHTQYGYCRVFENVEKLTLYLNEITAVLEE